MNSPGIQYAFPEAWMGRFIYHQRGTHGTGIRRWQYPLRPPDTRVNVYIVP